MTCVAFYTIGLLRQPLGSPAIVEYESLTADLWGRLSDAPGFLCRVKEEPVDRPRVARADGLFPVSTLSLWRDLESVFAFSYRGVHADALRRRSEWLLETGAPAYVAWWVPDQHMPTWTEAIDRYERLHEHGATPEAFDFRTAFDATGSPVKVKRPGRQQ